MNKKTLLLKIFGLFFLILPFFINVYSFFRLFSLLLGIFFLSIGIFLFKKNNFLQILFYPLFFFLVFYGFDFLQVSLFKRIPIFSFQNKSNDAFSTYDSLIYRVFDCNGEKNVDFFYQENYLCSFDLSPILINDFLLNVKSNFQKYHSKFITVKGKVSEVFGNDYLLLQSYEQNTNNLVGQLTFNKNAALKIVNNHEDLKLYGQYEIYDTVLITGKIIDFENNTVIMQDATIKIVPNFESYSINLIETKKCKNDIKEISKVGDFQYYSNCIDKIYVKYDQDTIYDIKFALETKKLTFDKWILHTEKKENETQELYQFENYNLLKCKNSNTILIGNPKLSLKNKFCETNKE